MNYKHKLTITFMAFITLTTSGLAAETAPGPGGGGDITQEIDLTGESWNNIGVNVEGVSLSDSTGSCELDSYETGGISGYAWTVSDGEWVALSQEDELSTTKGYSVYSTNDCTLTFEGSQAGTTGERQLSGEIWNLVTLPPGTSPSDLESAVESEGASLDTWEDEIFWTNLGTEWIHPVDELSNNRAVYVYPTESVTISLDGGATEDPGPGDDEDDSDGDDGDSSDGDDSSDSDEVTAEAGDLYFWDTDSSSALVNNEEGSPDDSATLSYDMYDDTINGRFTSHGSGERTITVEGPRGEASNTGSGNYVSFPAEGSDAWGPDEDGVHEMLGSYTDTTFTVTVEDAGTGEQIQEPEEFSFDPSGQAREITTDLENRNTDHVIISGSSLEFDGSGSNNAYATWEKDSGDDKIVEIDFEVNSPGHTRLEVCGESCADGDNGNIYGAYFFYGDNNVRVDEPYDGGSAYEDELIGQYEANSEYTFRIVEDGAEVTMELEGPGIDHSTEVEEGYTFEQYSIDTEHGTSDNWPGIDLTVNEVTAQDTD